ncbi:MAG TPA: substrate-binding domain-containing protein [Luteibacter sp.]|jgi:simple sugar transport system substrate-binding protein/ribose transport system substrate-binding protein|nr:substrate-binding domain-containing protein [Luteibacter sp.]
MKGFALVVFSVAVALGTACPASAGTVGIIASQGSAESQARSLHAASVAATAAGHQVVLHDARGSLDTYRALLNELIDRRVEAIVLVMGKPSDTDAELARAKAQGIHIASVATGSSRHVDIEVDANHYSAGVSSSLHLFRAMRDRGHLATLRFDGNVGARARGRIFDAVLPDYAEVREVARHTMTDTANWQQDVADGIAGILDEHGETLEGILVSFDAQALIVDDALKARDLDRRRVPLVTVDGSHAVYRRILMPDSSIVATVALPFEAMASKAVERLDAMIAGTGSAPGKILYEGILVDETNAAEFIDKDGT